jgi:hypothetical protein
MASMSQAGGAFLLLITATLGAQERVEPERPPAPGPLSVQMVVSRSGDKTAGGLVYSFPCNPRDRKTVIKSGVEVPVPVRKAEAVEFQYRNVGANIECESAAVAGGRYSVRIAFEHSSLVGADERPTAAGRTAEAIAAIAPVFRTSMSQFTTLLRDGERARVITGTDPLTGDVTAVDVTLAVLK